MIVFVKINDGIVMAADSAGTMSTGQVYTHANKITNLREGLPVGAMSTGASGIGNESCTTTTLSGAPWSSPRRRATTRHRGAWIRDADVLTPTCVSGHAMRT
jgi:hypothetical protein